MARARGVVVQSSRRAPDSRRSDQRLPPSAVGGCAAEQNLVPDLVTYGKVIGAGFPSRRTQAGPI
jgi:Glutamate-1-semialdehyde aminotransferase